MMVKKTCKNRFTAFIRTANKYSHASPDIMTAGDGSRKDAIPGKYAFVVRWGSYEEVQRWVSDSSLSSSRSGSRSCARGELAAGADEMGTERCKGADGVITAWADDAKSSGLKEME